MKAAVFLFLAAFCSLLMLAGINPLVSPKEAVVVARLHEFARSENISLPATELADGAWDKVCVFDYLSGFRPLYTLSHPPHNLEILWNWLFYWNWSELQSKTLGLVLVSTSRDMLLVKVDPYGMGDSTSLDFDPAVGCYEFDSATVKKTTRDGTTVLHVSETRSLARP